VTWDELEALAEQLPDDAAYDPEARSWSRSGSWFARERPLSKKDLSRLGSRAPDSEVVAVRVRDLATKATWVASEPRTCFTTPHFEGYPIVLVDLEQADPFVVEELLLDGYDVAPTKLRKQ